MKTLFADRRITYTGEQLRSHWSYETFGLLGDSGVAFLGPCDVPLERMVDVADVKAGLPIRARVMLHFIIEHFHTDLALAVLRQRLFACILAESLNRRIGRLAVTRAGDDLFVEDRKLTVSIATVSPVSSLCHVGVNVDPEGAPVAAIGLDELKIAPRELAEEVLQRYDSELELARDAACKVRPVCGASGG